MLVAVLLAFLAVFALLAWVAIAQAGALWRKWLGLLALALAVPVAVVAVHELTGRPKPLALEWIHDLREGATVVSYRFVEDEAIYLWLVLPDETAPRSYMLPWSRESAKELQEAESVAEQLHTEMEVELEDDPEHEAEFNLTFHAHTLPALPTKAYEVDESFTYERDADD